MKLSFSTLGCPQWSWQDIIAMAKDLSFDGIEIRGIGKELHAPKIREFLSENIQSTKDRLASTGLSIPCLTSSCLLSDKLNIETNIKEAREYIDTARAIGTKYIRVLGDKNAEVGDAVDLGFLTSNLYLLVEYAEKNDVVVLVETNGVLADSRRMKNLMEELNSPHAAVLWDIHHPFRFMGETIEDTYNTLKKYIAHIHVKDSVIEDGKLCYKMLGAGDIPVLSAIKLLKADSFGGFISLEWVKRWCPELEDAGIAFSHFTNYIKDNI